MGKGTVTIEFLIFREFGGKSGVLTEGHTVRENTAVACNTWLSRTVILFQASVRNAKENGL